ncbi:hypothetical protein D3C83_98010 [compost metagenome]
MVITNRFDVVFTAVQSCDLPTDQINIPGALVVDLNEIGTTRSWVEEHFIDHDVAFKRIFRQGER